MGGYHDIIFKKYQMFGDEGRLFSSFLRGSNKFLVNSTPSITSIRTFRRHRSMSTRERAVGRLWQDVENPVGTWVT